MAVAGLRFHHIGTVTANLESEIEQFKRLGFQVESEFRDSNPAINARGAFLTQGAFRIEILEPLDDSSPAASWLKRSIQMYHQAFATEAFDEKMKDLEQDGAILVVPPTKSLALGGARIAFFMLRNGMLIEILDLDGARQTS